MSERASGLRVPPPRQLCAAHCRLLACSCSHAAVSAIRYIYKSKITILRALPGSVMNVCTGPICAGGVPLYYSSPRRHNCECTNALSSESRIALASGRLPQNHFTHMGGPSLSSTHSLLDFHFDYFIAGDPYLRLVHHYLPLHVSLTYNMISTKQQKLNE